MKNVRGSNWRKKLEVKRGEVALPKDMLVWLSKRPKATFTEVWKEAITEDEEGEGDKPTVPLVWLPYLAWAGRATQGELVTSACGTALLYLAAIHVGRKEPAALALSTVTDWLDGRATKKQVTGARKAIYTGEDTSSQQEWFALMAVQMAVNTVDVSKSEYAVDAAAASLYYAERALISPVILLRAFTGWLILP